MKQWPSFLIVIVIIVFLSIYANSDTLAKFMWQNFKNADLALFLDKSDAELAMEIGNYYFNGGAYDLEEARKAFEEAKVIDPDLLGSRYQLSRIEFLRANFGQALDLANEELKRHPEYDRIFYLRGLIHGYAGRLSDAEKDFQKFLETHRQSWAAHNDLAWIYFRQGKFEKVAEVTKRGLQFNPGNPWLLTTYGTALLNLGKKNEARRILEEALVKTDQMTPEGWGKAYPGNNPKAYEEGLQSMRTTIRTNLVLASQ